jgi:hypothetical protein
VYCIPINTAIRNQEIGYQQKKAEKSEQNAIALRSGFQNFQGQHDDQQRYAGIASQQGAVFNQDAACRGQRNQSQQPFAGQWKAAVRQVNPP